MCKVLKIHADDYGYSENISQNILDCYKNGIINSLSVMIDTSDKLISKLINSNIENISLHLNLTSLASANNKEDEEFLKSLSFTKLFFLRNKKKEICKKEIDHQIRKFTKHFSNKDLRIDGHHHIQIIPWIFKYLINNYSDEIKSIRIPNEKLILLDLKYFFKLTFYRNLFASIVLKVMCRNILHHSKVRFAGLLYSGIYDKKSLQQHLNILQKSKLDSEITFHPGTGLESEKNYFKKSHFKYVSSKNRKNEYLLLINDKNSAF